MTAQPANIDDHILRMSRQLYPDESALSRGCRYALEGPGKRVRPALCLMAAQACDGDTGTALWPALAVEWVHTYSLVHDDLPILDDDDLRRGRPTVHRVFDDATALLVGDALLSDAFYILTGCDSTELGYDTRSAVRLLSRAIGGQGMVLGQHLDIKFTGTNDWTWQNLEDIHSRKTGQLISAALQLGALSAGACQQTQQLFGDVGQKIGLVFQLMDDLLDSRPDSGKTPGKDARSGKLTCLSVLSSDEAFCICGDLTATANSLLREHLGSKAGPLSDFIESLSRRVR